MRSRSRVAQQELFKERGINPLAGCLPLLLQMPLLFIMYSVIQNGLTNQNPSAMLEVFGVQVVPLTCTNVVNGVVDPYKPVHRHDHPVLRDLDRRQPAVDDLLASRSAGSSSGISILAIISAGLQLVQSRMMLPKTKPEDDDPNTKIQRQTMLFLPLISVAYGGFLPAGLFIYWITATIFSDRPAVPDRGLGRHVPDLRLDPGGSPPTTPRDSRWRCHRHPIRASVRPS